ncbi:hypothetical protein [Sphingomonas sp. dw_22]|uniref:hypothetical protein n=1 Tax=Sphingomonas sp. dw_22 TaxID=2721175 RepID=UPI002116EB53|nr:hypothetical protein [Sphingomonas sp. dw_22]
MSERFRATFRRRGAAFVLALIVELLIALLLLGLIPTITPKEKPKTVTFGISTNEGKEPASKEQAKAKAKAKAEQGDKPEPQPQPVKPEIVPPPPVPEAKQPPSFVVLTRQDYAAGDISRAKSSGPMSTADAGSADNGGSPGAGDSETAGKGPHGETLYAAEWYRRPRDAELSPYIPERARGVEGWGEIACRTVARYHVEDCQELGDYPRGSGYAGAVRQAAFQFLVKPPRVNGQLQVGTWVRIRITYTQHGGE